jgi:hypothetical protein
VRTVFRTSLLIVVAASVLILAGCSATGGPTFGAAPTLNDQEHFEVFIATSRVFNGNAVKPTAEETALEAKLIAVAKAKPTASFTTPSGVRKTMRQVLGDEAVRIAKSRPALAAELKKAYDSLPK